MSSVFTQIISGELPGRIIWRDDVCVAMLDIRPLRRGHVLVTPISEVHQWTELPNDIVTHCMGVAHSIGKAQQKAFAPKRVGLVVAGFEVPHAHIHVVPIDEMDDLDFSKADPNVDPQELDWAAEQLRDTLRSDGHSCVV